MPVILKEEENKFRVLDPFYTGEWEMDHEALISYFEFLDYLKDLSLDDSVRFSKKDKVIDVPDPYKTFIDNGLPLNCDFNIQKVLTHINKVKSGIMNPPIPIFEVTPVCNFKCPWCYIPHDNRKRLPLETIREKIVIPLLQRGTHIFVLSGGEPSVELSRLSKICNIINTEAEKLNVKPTILLLSNGYRLSSNIELYQEIGISNIQVSVISMNPKINNQLRKVPKGVNSAEDAFLGTKKAVEAGMGVSYNFVLLPEMDGIPSNIREIPDMVKLAKHLGVYMIRIVPVVSSGEASKNNISIGLDQLKEARILIEEAIKMHGNDLIVYSPIGYDVPPHKPVYCRAGNDVIYINSEGKVYPCNNLIFSDFLCDENPVGKRDILEIWEDSKLLQRFRYPSKLNNTCFNCSLRTECGGQCRAQIYGKYNQLDLSKCPGACYISE